jgi:hypothetical protein
MRDAYIHQIFAVFYGNPRFIIMFTAALYFPHPEPDISNALSLNPHLREFLLPSRPRLGLPSYHIPSGFPNITFKAYGFSQQHST